MNKQTLLGILLGTALILIGYSVMHRAPQVASLDEHLAPMVQIAPRDQENMSANDAASSKNSTMGSTTVKKVMSPKKDTVATTIKTALLGDGCFWCAEHDIEEVAGVIDAVSGYAGGTGDNPTYQNYAENGFREVVLVTYDSSKVSFANLVEHIIKHGDPTDSGGSFHDRGAQYVPAIYFDNDEEKTDARRVIDALDALRVFPEPLPLLVIPRVKFWPAEDYHQDYGKKNPVRYGYYRGGSGRNAFIEKYWGGKANEFTVTQLPISTAIKSVGVGGGVHPWESFVKPSETKLRAMLTALQYQVTQEKGTEPSHDNLYDKNYALGIYVDIVSGEPLYSSTDKFDSGTGWPSFVKPIATNAVVLKEDKSFFGTRRTEVRSRIADSHIGHVFDDGPVDRGGKRYCMNSAAMRFIPKAEMGKEGYSEFLELIK